MVIVVLHVDLFGPTSQFWDKLTMLALAGTSLNKTEKRNNGFYSQVFGGNPSKPC
jgi:hypothetical protein